MKAEPKRSNQSKTTLRNRLVHNGGIVGRGRGRAGASTGARAD
jgi:hypothetical protein